MKNKLIILAVSLCVLTLTLSLAACNNTTTTEKLLERNWPENGKETFTYSVTTGNSVVGTLVLSVANIDGGYRIERNQTMTNGDIITGYVNFSNMSSKFAFPPLESSCTQTVAGVTDTDKIVYNGGNITCYHADGATISEDTAGINHEISTPYYDNMQFYTIIRGADFGNKFSLSFNVFVPAENGVVPLTCSLGNNENLSYKLSDADAAVDCQLVNIYRKQSVAGEPLKAYYSKSNITVGGKTVKQALIRFIENNYTYSLTDITVS